MSRVLFKLTNYSFLWGIFFEFVTKVEDWMIKESSVSIWKAEGGQRERERKRKRKRERGVNSLACLPSSKRPPNSPTNDRRKNVACSSMVYGKQGLRNI